MKQIKYISLINYTPDIPALYLLRTKAVHSSVRSTPERRMYGASASRIRAWYQQGVVNNYL